MCLRLVDLDVAKYHGDAVYIGVKIGLVPIFSLQSNLGSCQASFRAFDILPLTFLQLRLWNGFAAFFVINVDGDSIRIVLRKNVVTQNPYEIYLGLSVLEGGLPNMRE